MVELRNWKLNYRLWWNRDSAKLCVGFGFFPRKQMVLCLDLFLYGSSEVLHCWWLLAMDLDLFSEVRFLRLGMCVMRKSLLQLLPKAVFVKGQFAIVVLTDVFLLPCVSAPDLVCCKTFNEQRPCAILMYTWLFLAMFLCKISLSLTSSIALTIAL